MDSRAPNFCGPLWQGLLAQHRWACFWAVRLCEPASVAVVVAVGRGVGGSMELIEQRHFVLAQLP